jgi:hypothetical protein
VGTAVIVAIVLVALLGVLAVGFVLYSRQRQQRKARLRENFGPEYERTVEETGGSREAEKELQARQRRIEKLHIVELSPDQQRDFAGRWRVAQAHFVDDPSGAISEADELVIAVMSARGYPLSDFDQRAADVSVEHPEVVQNYRAAHTLAEGNTKDGPSTEDLRQAMVYYRSLFDELLGASASGQQRNGGSR